MAEQIDVDVTPGAHSFLDALGTVSFKLACGCNVRARSARTVTDEDAIINFKTAGGDYPCPRHGEQVIVRSTTRLAGWKAPSGWRARRG